LANVQNARILKSADGHGEVDSEGHAEENVGSPIDVIDVAKRFQEEADPRGASGQVN
jgi:hypothetical protein